MKKGFKISLIALGSFILLLILIGIFVPESEEMKQQKIREAERQAELEKIKTTPEWIAKKEKTEIEESIKKYFGVPKKDNDSGIYDFQYVNHECIVGYKFYPLGLFKYETELGSRLATKIKLMYEKHPTIKNIIIHVASPFQDKYGNITWKEVGSFEFSKGLNNRINWDNFNSQDLLKVAENVKGF